MSGKALEQQDGLIRIQKYFADTPNRISKNTDYLNRVLKKLSPAEQKQFNAVVQENVITR